MYEKEIPCRQGAAPETHSGKRSDPWAEREAQRYERPIPSREAILALLEERGELMREDAIAEALGLTEAGRPARRWTSAWARWCATASCCAPGATATAWRASWT